MKRRGESLVPQPVVVHCRIIHRIRIELRAAKHPSAGAETTPLRCSVNSSPLSVIRLIARRHTPLTARTGDNSVRYGWQAEDGDRHCAFLNQSPCFQPVLPALFKARQRCPHGACANLPDPRSLWAIPVLMSGVMPVSTTRRCLAPGTPPGNPSRGSATAYSFKVNFRHLFRYRSGRFHATAPTKRVTPGAAIIAAPPIPKFR